MKSTTTYHVNPNSGLADPFSGGIKSLYCSDEYRNNAYEIACGKRCRIDWDTLDIQKFTKEVEEFITDKLKEEAEDFFGDSISISNVHVEWDTGDYQFDIICNKEGMFRRQAEKQITYNKCSFSDRVEWPIEEVFSKLIYDGGIFKFSEETPLVDIKTYIGQGEVKIYKEQDIKELVKKYGGIDFEKLRAEWKNQYDSYTKMFPNQSGPDYEYEEKLKLLDKYADAQSEFLIDASSSYNSYDIKAQLKEIADDFDKELEEIELKTKHLWKESKTMKKRISENTKITLTVRQLRKLIKEATEESNPELAKLEEILPMEDLEKHFDGTTARIPRKFYNIYREGQSTVVLWPDYRHGYKLSFSRAGAELIELNGNKVIWSMANVKSVEQLYKDVSFARTIMDITKTRL